MKTLTIQTAGVEAEVMTKQEELPSFLGLHQVWQLPRMAWAATHPERVRTDTEVFSFPQDYYLAALVEASDLPRVFGYMNPCHGEEEVFAKRVIPLRSDWRSCSIGDVIVDPDGKAHWVASYGFRELSM